MSETAAAPNIAPTVSNFAAGVQANVARAATPTQTPAQQPAAGNGAPQQNGIAPQLTAELAAKLEQPAEVQPEQQVQDPNAAPPDPWAEQIHGITARDLIDAAKRGELPESVLTNIKIGVKVNGKEMQVSLREAANSYMRISDYTQETQRLATANQQLESVKGKLRSVFDGIDKPEGFEKFVQNNGMVGQARAMLTKNWGTPDKPNVQGYLEDMWRNGHFGTFRAAAQAYAEDYARHLAAFPIPQGTPPERAQQIRQYAEELWQRREADQAATWKTRLEAETLAEQARRDAAKREREQLLAQRQAPQANLQEVKRQVNALRDQNFQRLGVPTNNPKLLDLAQKYFDDAMPILTRIAARNGYDKSIEDIAAEAAQSAFEQLQSQQAIPAGATQQPAPQQQALPPRPAGAPTTSAVAPRKGGSVTEFEEYLRSGR